MVLPNKLVESFPAFAVIASKAVRLTFEWGPLYGALLNECLGRPTSKFNEDQA